MIYICSHTALRLAGNANFILAFIHHMADYEILFLAYGRSIFGHGIAGAVLSLTSRSA
jgi:hypothetical protein